MKARIRKIVIGIIGMFILSPSLILAQLSLDSCQAKARNNYPLIHQYGLIEQSKELTLSNANKNYLPQLDVNFIGGVIGGLPSFAPPGSESSSSAEANFISVIQLNQAIWDGGMTKASKGMISANAEIDKASLDVNLYTLNDRVNNIYFGVLLIDEQIAQLDLLLERLERNKSRVEIAVENGSAFNSDVDEIRVELLNVLQKKAELTYNKKAYLQVLSAMIGEPLSDNAQLERPYFGLETDSLSIQRPELKKFENQRALIESQAKLNKSMLMPKLGFLAFGVLLTPGVDFGVSTLNNLGVVGLSLSWSLGPLYKNGNNKKLNSISLQQVNIQEETFLFNTKLELNQTQKELEKYSLLIEQDFEMLKLKSNISQAYITKYDNGIATMSSMLDKINDENAAKQNMIMHEIQYLMTAYQYLNKSGN